MSLVLSLDNPEIMDFLGSQESQFLESPKFFHDDVRKLLLLGDEIEGDCLPWTKTHDKFRMREGEITVWAGINGHGKSNVLGHILCHLLESQKVCLASLEMRPNKLIKRMLRQSSGVENVGVKFHDDWEEATEGSFFIYDQLDSLPSDRILAMCHYAAKKLGSKHIMIDSLMKCGIDEDDYNEQGNFVNKLCWIAKQHNVHIHLVHHMRKGRSEEDIPDKFDVRGASRITDMVDNLVIVHRNKSKERKVARGIEVDVLEPDARLRVAKQRHGEWEGDIMLYFDTPTQQYRSSPDSRPMRVDLERIAEV